MGNASRICRVARLLKPFDMKKSVIFAWATLCFLPLLFSFKEAPIPPTNAEGIIVRVAPSTHKKSFVIRLANLQQRPARIIIIDSYDRTRYSEKILGHNGYRKLINLKDLTPGEYTLYVLHPDESKSGTIKVGPGDLQISWNEEG